MQTSQLPNFQKSKFRLGLALFASPLKHYVLDAYRVVLAMRPATARDVSECRRKKKKKREVLCVEFTLMNRKCECDGELSYI